MKYYCSSLILHLIPVFNSSFFVPLSRPHSPVINLQPGGSAGAKQHRPTGSSSQTINLSISISLTNPVPLRAGNLTTRSGCHIAFFSVAGTKCLALPGLELCPPKLGKRRAPREIRSGVVCLHSAQAKLCFDLGDFSHCTLELLYLSFRVLV